MNPLTNQTKMFVRSSPRYIETVRAIRDAEAMECEDCAADEYVDAPSNPAPFPPGCDPTYFTRHGQPIITYDDQSHCPLFTGEPDGFAMPELEMDFGEHRILRYDATGKLVLVYSTTADKLPQFEPSESCLLEIENDMQAYQFIKERLEHRMRIQRQYEIDYAYKLKAVKKSSIAKRKGPPEDVAKEYALKRMYMNIGTFA